MEQRPLETRQTPQTVHLVGSVHLPALRFAIVAAAVSILSGLLLAQQLSGGLTPQADKSGSTSRLQDRTFQSGSLSRAMTYRILLPSNYFETTRNYPVLYLLHGWHGDYKNWSTLTGLTRYAEDLPLIIVMPDAGDSWYTDSATSTEDKFERYLVHDLIKEVDQHWRTVRSPRGRGIAGLSMGGYGAVKEALKYPDIFHVGASISGAFNATSTELAKQRSDLQPSLTKAFGPASSNSRKQNDVYLLVNSVSTQQAPYLYIDCGNQDSSFLEANRKLISLLSQRKFAYEYHEYPGEHTWQYWDQRLPAALSLVRQRIIDPNASPNNAESRLSFPYADGWLGADDAYSIPFGPDKSIWLFGDTFVADKTTTVRTNRSQ